MATEVRLDLVANDKASKDIKSVSNSTKEATTQTTLLGGAMNMVRGAMTKVKATSKLLFGSIKAGLISTGIGAFVVVIGSLVAYFTQTKKGAELLEQSFAAFGAIVSVITDRISSLGSTIVDAFTNPKKAIAGLWDAIKTNLINRVEGVIDSFKFLGKTIKAAMDLDWEGMKAGAAGFTESVVQATTGIDDLQGKLARGVKGLANEISEEASAAARLKGELQNLKDAARGFNIEKAKTNQEIAKALLLAEDESESNEKRLEALKEALVLEEETTEKQLELQRRKVAAIEEEVALGESLEEDLDRLNEEKIRLIELETASIKMKKKVVTQVNDFEKQIASEELARIKERTEAQAEATKIKEEAAAKQTELDNVETERLATQEETRQTNIVSIVDKFKLEKEETELQAIETEKEKQLAELDRLEASEQDKADVKAFFSQKTLDVLKTQADKEKALEKAKVKATKDTNNETLAAVGNLAGALGDLAGESKALAVGEATISTYLGATKALAAGAGTPAGYINAAGIIVAGLANVKTILSTDVGGSGGGSVPSTGGTPSVGGNLASSIPAATGLGDVVNSVNAQGQAPVEAFVISQTVTDSQEAQSYINNQRTL